MIGTYNRYETLTFSNFRNYSYTEDIGANNYTEIWGRWNCGVDGDIQERLCHISNVYDSTYDVLTTVTETITQLVLSTQETVYNTSKNCYKYIQVILLQIQVYRNRL